MKQTRTKKHYINFNCNKTTTQQELGAKNFEKFANKIAEKLNDCYKLIVVNSAVFEEEFDCTESLIKIFNPVSKGYKILKDISNSKKCKINYNSLMVDIDNFSKSKEEIYVDLVDDLIAFEKMQEVEKEI